MRKMLPLIAALLLFPASSFAKEVTTTLKIEGWHCEGCSSQTEGALKKVPGVKSVKSSFADRTATVVHDDAKASTADLEKAVGDSGYKVAR